MKVYKAEITEDEMNALRSVIYVSENKGYEERELWDMIKRIEESNIDRRINMNEKYLTEQDEVAENEHYGMELKGERVEVVILDVLNPTYVYVKVVGVDRNVYTPTENLYHLG